MTFEQVKKIYMDDYTEFEVNNNAYRMLATPKQINFMTKLAVESGHIIVPLSGYTKKQVGKVIDVYLQNKGKDFSKLENALNGLDLALRKE